jgi:hypothetical protein
MHIGADGVVRLSAFLLTKVRRVVFSVLIGNADMHLKNWSLRYPDRRKPGQTLYATEVQAFPKLFI